VSQATSIGIAITIFTVFSFMALLLPFIYEEFGVSATEIDSDDFSDQLGQEDIDTFGFIESFISVFFWSFGNFHPIVEGILLIFRVSFVVAIASLLRGV